MKTLTRIVLAVILLPLWLPLMCVGIVSFAILITAAFGVVLIVAAWDKWVLLKTDLNGS